MAVPSVASSNPANGDSDAYINVNPTITFDAALDSASVTEESVQLFDMTSNARVPVTLNYDSSVWKITIVTDGTLRENTSYRILLTGTDLRIGSSKVLSGSAAGDDLTTSIVIEFSTGDNVYDRDSTLVKEADAKTLEGDLFLPSNVKALGTEFTIERVRPQNYTAGNATGLTGDKTVKFTFTKDLNTTGNFTRWVEIETYPLVTTGYLGKTGTLQVLTTGDYSMPTGTISVDGKQLVITFSKTFPNNAGIDINVLNTVESSSGLDYGGGMEYSISTALYPEVVSPRTIKRELRHIDGDSLRDNYVAALIHKNTIFIWESMGRGLTLGNFSYAAWRHVFFSTMLDIMEDQDYAKFLTSGTRKQLGDLNVSIDSLIGRLALKIASAQKNRATALKTLHAGWEFKTAIKMDGAVGEIDHNRLWYNVNGRFTASLKKFDQPAIPASNTATSRGAKTNNPWW